MTHPALVPPLAIERYRVLEPHLADGIPLAVCRATIGAGCTCRNIWSN
ncbi:hypothetical protein [Sphingobium yanoikuyae]|nr:hypothetical protein [Sphingobium yanoikuyae]